MDVDRPGHAAVRVLSKHDPDGLPPGHAEELLNVCMENALSAMDVRTPSVRVNKDALDLAKTLQDGADVGLKGAWRYTCECDCHYLGEVACSCDDDGSEMGMTESRFGGKDACRCGWYE